MYFPLTFWDQRRLFPCKKEYFKEVFLSAFIDWSVCFPCVTFEFLVTVWGAALAPAASKAAAAHDLMDPKLGPLTLLLLLLWCNLSPLVSGGEWLFISYACLLFTARFSVGESLIVPVCLFIPHELNGVILFHHIGELGGIFVSEYVSWWILTSTLFSFPQLCLCVTSAARPTTTSRSTAPAAPLQCHILSSSKSAAGTKCLLSPKN